MTSLSRVWKDKRLTLSAKIRLYQVLVVSVLLYAAETWTLLAADTRTLEAFQHPILSVRWYDRIRNDKVALRTGLSPITDYIANRRCATSPVCLRLSRQMRYHVDASLGGPPLPTWKRRPDAHATAGWSKSDLILVLLQRTYGIEQLNMDTERCYGPGWLCNNDDDDCSTTDNGIIIITLIPTL